MVKSRPKKGGGKKKPQPKEGVEKPKKARLSIVGEDGVVRKTAAASDEQIAPTSAKDNRTLDIRNKNKRGRMYEKYKIEKSARKTARRERRRVARETMGDAAPPKLEPKTIESMRPYEDTYVSSGDEELEGDEQDDEFAEFFQDGVEPKILFTADKHPCRRTLAFIEDLMKLFPNSEYFRRYSYTTRQITQYAVDRGYTDLIMLGDSGGGQKARPYHFIIQHLPQGPTFCFRLSSVILHDELKKPADRSGHYPELILKNFSTRLGRRLRRQFQSLFPQQRDFAGRGVVTFYNLRDFIFVRAHRYVFKGMDKVTTQEIGPRFTLRIKFMQAGLYDSSLGDYEWVRKKREMDKNRLRFHV
eukprot:Hpha_TRINITY_DN25936_c0_g1::TRINITY_DN25936_c0_g1_i1::g.185323::m.185323/K14846/RPF1; ribosome production factor 1